MLLARVKRFGSVACRWKDVTEKLLHRRIIDINAD